jgi:hypothetical protein
MQNFRPYSCLICWKISDLTLSVRGPDFITHTCQTKLLEEYVYVGKILNLGIHMWSLGLVTRFTSLACFFCVKRHLCYYKIKHAVRLQLSLVSGLAGTVLTLC